MNTRKDPDIDREQLAQLLTQSGQRDQQAFAELYRRTSGKLHGVCLRMLRDRGVAEQVLQEIYITIWQRADRFDAARAGAMTWLTTIARNKAIDHLRRHREVLVDDQERLNNAVDDAASPIERAQESEDHRRLRHCLDGLENKHRDLVREAFFSGATYNQLSERLNVPLGTMKSWIRRSLIKLRTCLEHSTAA
ncbi:MAG TPA: sigma-70 family RNA polymerase sigma factor [Rhodanobacteraceae bacterium]|nr:sigma-70 family RNA polymerase sigma factor [Rhodanobacteraceae bacterium]